MLAGSSDTGCDVGRREHHPDTRNCSASNASDGCMAKAAASGPVRPFTTGL